MEAARLLSHLVGGGRKLAASVQDRGRGAAAGASAAPKLAVILAKEKQGEGGVGASIDAELLRAGLARVAPPRAQHQCGAAAGGAGACGAPAGPGELSFPVAVPLWWFSLLAAGNCRACSSICGLPEKAICDKLVAMLLWHRLRPARRPRWRP